jgi:DNA-binding transcriptional LysR family regulator
MGESTLAELRFADMQALLVVARLSSITAAARHLGVTPSQVSRAVTRIETHFGAQFLRRSAHGAALTDVGRRLLPKLEDILVRLREVRHEEEGPGTMLTFAAPSYMNAAMVGVIVRAIPIVRIRCLELPPSLVRTFAAANLFDATLLIGEPRLPSGWTATRVGTCRKAFFGSPKVSEAIGPQPASIVRLRAFPFVRPVYNVGGQFVPVDDDCPVPWHLRRSGHEAQTIGMALDLAASSDQLVYGPAFAAFDHLSRGTLTEIVVKGVEVTADIHFACQEERMLARVQTALVKALTAGFAALEDGTRKLNVARP